MLQVDLSRPRCTLNVHSKLTRNFCFIFSWLLSNWNFFQGFCLYCILSVGRVDQRIDHRPFSQPVCYRWTISQNFTIIITTRWLEYHNRVISKPSFEITDLPIPIAKPSIVVVVVFQFERWCNKYTCKCGILIPLYG